MAPIELAIADDALALGADVDENLVLVDPHNRAFDNVPVLEALDVGVLLGQQLGHRGRLGAGRWTTHDRRLRLVGVFGGRRIGDVRGGHALGDRSGMFGDCRLGDRVLGDRVLGHCRLGNGVVRDWVFRDRVLGNGMLRGRVFRDCVLGSMRRCVVGRSTRFAVGVAGRHRIHGVDGGGLVGDRNGAGGVLRRLIGRRGVCLRLRRSPAQLVFCQGIHTPGLMMSPGNQNDLSRAQAVDADQWCVAVRAAVRSVRCRVRGSVPLCPVPRAG